jgi:alpha-galactosidase
MSNVSTEKIERESVSRLDEETAANIRRYLEQTEKFMTPQHMLLHEDTELTNLSKTTDNKRDKD